MQAQVAPVPLVGSHWTLVAIGEETVEPRHEATAPHLVFDARGGVSGADGCRALTGTYSADRFTMTVRVEPAAPGTCTAAGRLETRLRDALKQTRRWNIDGSTLTLRDGNGAALARFEGFDAR